MKIPIKVETVKSVGLRYKQKQEEEEEKRQKVYILLVEGMMYTFR